MSPIDKLFEEIFGEKPGTSYEMIACIAEHLVNGGQVSHDKKIRGAFSETLYQIDVLSGENKSLKMGEVKDYTIQGKKVGRGDLQKLGGALPDLPNVVSGKFFSATGYTEPAVKYAKHADKFSGGKGIELFELRPATELDEDGLIRTIAVSILFYKPLTERISWKPHLSQHGKEAFKSLKDENGYVKFNTEVKCFFDKNNNETISIFELTNRDFGEINRDTGCSPASFVLKEHYVKLNGVLGGMLGLEYKIPYAVAEQKIEITNDAELKFVLKDINGNIISYLTDAMLRQYSFDHDRNLIAS